MKDLTILIPISKWDDNTKDYLERAVESIKLSTLQPFEVIVSLPNDTSIHDMLPNAKHVVNEPESPISKIINELVSEVKTKYFTIISPYGQFSRTWFENVERHVKLDKDISMFLPIVNMYSEEEKFVGFHNEVYWAQAFTSGTDLGFIDEESLKDTFNLHLNGSIINKQDFLEVGGLKESMKFYWWYEFILRLVYNKKAAYVIPKSLYSYIPIEEKELFKDVEEEEVKFYYELSQKEYFIKDDRNKSYVKEEKSL